MPSEQPGRSDGDRNADARESRSGGPKLDAPTAEKAAAPDAEVQARIEERSRTTNLGAVLAARGETTVALDAEGTLTEYQPDGSSRPISS